VVELVSEVIVDIAQHELRISLRDGRMSYVQRSAKRILEKLRTMRGLVQGALMPHTHANEAGSACWSQPYLL
jgi:hypothetical protein